MKCPTKGKLKQFADGQMSGADIRIISVHLDGCSECRATLDKLQAESSLVREKTALLDPTGIPALSFELSQTELVRGRRLPAFSMLWRGSVRIPLAVLVIIGLVLIGLTAGLAVQGRRLARQASPPAFQAQAKAMLISARSSFEAYGSDIDLKNYQPIDHPDVIVLQEEPR